MSTGTITLIVMTSGEKDSWLKELEHRVYSPRYDVSLDLIGAGQIVQKAKRLDQDTQIRVSYTATITQVTAIARRCYEGYYKNYVEVETRKGVPYGYPVEYDLYYPALSDKRLDGSIRVSDLGLADGDLVIIKQRKTMSGRRLPLAIIASTPSFKDFQQMVWNNQDPDDPMLLATLLYTDADVELAKYVREHFDELHQMSGPRVILYVFEHPPRDSTYAAPLFWKAQLDTAIYNAWAILGWTRSKPYDKTASYEIARSFGIFPDQLPCLSVFDRTDQEDKIVFPVSGDLTTFFRKTFSNIQHALYLGPGYEISTKILRNRERRKLFNKIRESLSLVQMDMEGKQIIYNFYGQTVFINHPSGSVQLQDFQNIR